MSNLTPIRRFITTHDRSTGKSVVLSTASTKWQQIGSGTLLFNVAYTTNEFPPDMNDEQDIKAHEILMASNRLGLVNPGGTVCRYVDFCPQNDNPLMHRTQSLDFGVVIEGIIEMHLDSGEVHVLKRGDIAIQRATMHAWRNPSSTEWARMLFILQDCKPINVNGRNLKEDLGMETDIPPSGNEHGQAAMYHLEQNNPATLL
ncbi:hypothetical protein BGZ63DRAFT_366609 [Mariannaea sp. PMI_226]|nr:hypothetical protein BGZ63DRAFT_366609 [Mariannaea sp. PMI_226]